MRDQSADVEIERAIIVLVQSFEASGDNPKPVVLHCIRVGMRLYKGGYDPKIVISALLHDLLEDTDVTTEEIASQFGTEVAEIVAATSFDSNIEDDRERYRDMFERCFNVGRAAVIVKAADILDNSRYYHRAESAELRMLLVEKMRYFIDNAEPFLHNEPLYHELTEAYSTVQQRIL